MELSIQMIYHIQLTITELRLINAALWGTLSEPQKKEAAELSTLLCQQRVNQGKQLLRELDKLENNLKNARATETGEAL